MKYLVLRRRWLAVIGITSLLTSALVVVGLAGCANEHDGKVTTRPAEPTDVIDQELMLSLLTAKNFHRKAQVYMSDGKLVEATASVREILSLKFPAGAPEAEDVRNDARALLSKLLVGQGQIEEAMTVVTEGIAGSQRESFFVANLYTAKGDVHQARAAALDASNPSNDPIIKQEKRAAIEAYDKSNSINTVLQQRLMEEK
jgi:hypothetical protein